MLHDPSHITPVPSEEEIHLTMSDKDILRQLASEKAEIAAQSIHKEKAKLWTNLNDLESKRPMVWINEIPWHEMNVNDELTLRCQHPWARQLEDRLRKELYQWRHMPADMVVNPYIECELQIHSTDFGIKEEVEVARTDADNDIYSRHFKIQITGPEDIEKIKMPIVTHNEKATDISYNTMLDLFEGIIPVKKVGQTHVWFTPWDYLVRWWGVQEAMMDLILRPNMVNDAVERMVQAWMAEMDQFEAQNLLSLDANNTRVGSGGYGYSSELPGGDFNPDHVKAHNMWGCSNAQIFSEVSPEMHWEYAIEHDMKWLSRFGLNYYGCCEPLHNKIHLMKKIPNLRKISTSPWCNSEKIINDVGADYVLSRKPNPVVFAGDHWRPDQAKKDLTDFMEITEGKAHVEFIMKDISTVGYKPERLWEWSKIAMDVAESYTK